MEEPFSKFMLKLDIENYFRQWTKIQAFASSGIQHTQTCWWLEQLSICAKYWILPNKNIRFIGQNL